MIFCSRVFSCTFLGRLSIYCPNSASLLFRVPNFAILEIRTRISGRFGPFMTLVVGINFPTVLPGARISYSPSKFFFCRWAACILCAIFTCTLRLLRGIGLEIPSDHMRRDSPSFIFFCSSWTRAFAAHITFSISTSKHMPVSAHCVSER